MKEFLIKVDIIDETPNSTVSVMRVPNPNDKRGHSTMYLIEDGFREKKEYGVTRIRGGKYKLEPIYAGKFYEKYKTKLGHRFAIGVKDVPNFKYIRIHTGNKVTHSLGCPLVNNGFYLDPSAKLYVGRDSYNAYDHFYHLIKDQVLAGNCWIGINRH